MSTAAQIEANRANAQASKGPRKAAGLIAASRNSITNGLYTINDFVRPGEEFEYRQHGEKLWHELNPATPLERTFVTEIAKASWRLRRCALTEATFDCEVDPLEVEALARIQISVDRARAQAHTILRRSLAELRRLQESRLAATPELASDPEPAAKTEITKRTQSAEPETPRNALCPCGSGTKYKRCCGTNAPAVLHFGAPRLSNPRETSPFLPASL